MKLSRRILSAVLTFTLSGLGSTAFAAAPKKPAPKAKSATESPTEKKDEKKDDKKKDEKKAEVKEERVGPASFNASATARPASQSAEDAKKEEAEDKLREEEINNLKTVIKQMPADSTTKGELIFQLAELYYERSKFLYSREMRNYFGAQDDVAARRDKGEKVDDPKLDTRQSDLWRGEALRLYQQILKEYPKYERKDEVLFTLAYNQYEDPKSRAQAVANYSTLIKEYKESKFVPDAYVQLGEHFFNGNELDKAKKAYSEALKSKTPKIYSFALYKLAWCDYNAGDYENAIKKFKEVVSYTDKANEGKKGDKIALKGEALNDIVLSFVQVEATDEAIQYFEANTTKKKARRLTRRLAGTMAESGKHDSAIKVYRYLIGADPADVDAPGWQNAIIKSYEQLRRRDLVGKEMRLLVANYGPKSQWAQTNKDNKSAIAQAYEDTEGAMRGMVTEYHQEAQRTKDVATYKLARDIYKEYLDSFDASEHAFNLRFYYAEILYTLQEWEPAAETYSKVVVSPTGEYGNKDYVKTAAFNALLAYEKLAAIGRGELKQETLKENEKIDEKKSKGQAQKVTVKLERHASDAKEEEIPKWESKLATACDSYAEMAKDSADEINVRYKAAFIYYSHRHDVEAATRFGYIINKWPTDASSRKAADFTLDILNTKKQWGELNRLARQFFANKKLTGADKEFTQRLAELVEGSQYNIDEELYKVQKKPAEAAVAFREFVKEFPKSKYAPQALLYSMIIFQDASQLDQGIEVGEQLIKEYPESKFFPRTHLFLGSFYDKTSQYAPSAKAYEAYVKLWEKAHGLATDDKDAKKGAKVAAKPAPKPAPAKPAAAKKAGEADAKGEESAAKEDPIAELDEKVADALFNAALWHEGMGEDEQAIALYTKYVDYSTKKLPGFEKKSDAPEVFFNIGLIYEKAKNFKEATKYYEQYVTRFGKDVTPSKVYTAKYKQFAALREVHPPTVAAKHSEHPDVAKLMEELNKGFAKLDEKARKEDSVFNAYGHIRFLMLEPAWRDYQAINFKNEKQLLADLKAKTKKTEELEKAYTDVLATGSAEWGIAGLTRIGLAYQDFAKGLIDSPDPKGLDMDQIGMYRAEIENRAFPLEEKAVEALEKALEKSAELKVYSEYTLKAQDQLNKVRPGAFGEVRNLNYRGSEFFKSGGPTVAKVDVPPPPPAPAAPTTPPAAN